MSTPSRTAPQDRIPLIQKVMFSLGANTEYVAVTLVTSVLWLPFFNIGLGMSPALLAGVLILMRIWDAISDPFMGNITDNARTRWGRRKPFIVAGALLAAVLFPLFWYVPTAWSETAKLVYLLGLGLVFFTCFTMWAMPYYALQMELTPDYDERTRLNAWGTAFTKLSYLGGSWLLALVTGPLFFNAETGKPDIVAGMRTVCWFLAGLILVLGLLPAIFTKERAYVAKAAKQPRQKFWASVKDSAGCKPLWPLIGITFFLVLGYSSVSAVAHYVYVYQVFDGDLNAGSVLFGWRATVNVTVGLASIPLLAWLGQKYDKKRMVIAMLVLCIGGHLLYPVFMQAGEPYLLLIPAALESCGIAAVWMFLPSMKADVADYDEMSTARRREGSINAFYSWFVKASLTASVGVGGFVLEFSGFSAANAQQPPEVLRTMFGLFVALPILFWVIALGLALFYPLGRTRMVAIREELEARRGAL